MRFPFLFLSCSLSFLYFLTDADLTPTLPYIYLVLDYIDDLRDAFWNCIFLLSVSSESVQCITPNFRFSPIFCIFSFYPTGRLQRSTPPSNRIIDLNAETKESNETTTKKKKENEDKNVRILILKFVENEDKR